MERILKFDTVPSKYWSMKTKIEYLQRRIIVWSILYYDFDFSAISDYDYTCIAFQLAEMQNKNKTDAEKTKYWYAFYDFDGSTGYHLYGRLSEEDKKHLSRIAQTVYENRR